MSVASGKTKGSRTECPDVPSDLNLGALYTRGIVVGFAEYDPLAYAHGTLVILPYQHGGQFGHGKGVANSNHQGKSVRYALWCHVYAYVNVVFFNCMGFVFYISILYRNIEQLSNHKQTKNRKGMGPERL